MEKIVLTENCLEKIFIEQFGQLMACNKKNIFFFFKNYRENEAGRLVPNLFLFLRKALYEVEASFS